MDKTIKLPSVANVAAGSTMSLQIPRGHVIDAVILEMTNITLAQLTNIELRIAGKPVMKFASGTEIDEINQFYGRGASASGVLALWFMRPELMKHYVTDKAGRVVPAGRLTSLGTSDIPTLTLHADINAACVSPACTARALTSGVGQPLGLINKVKRFPYNSAVSGEVQVDNIPRVARIAAIHFKKADVDAVTIDVDSVEVFNASKTTAHEVAGYNGRTAQAGYTHVDFIQAGDITKALILAGVQDFRAKMDLGTSGAFDIIVEYLDGLEGI